MRNWLLLISVMFLLCGFSMKSKPKADKEEAKKAYELINKIRKEPKKYAKELKLGKNLKITNTPLVWNDTLAEVARDKAMDMAKRNYYGHTDPDGYGMNHFILKSGYKLNAKWTANKSDNFFESVGAGMDSGEEAVRTFVLDEGVKDFGHRNHLLGIGVWDASLKDIGIGFVRMESGSDYKTYVCVIIAKHQ